MGTELKIVEPEIKDIEVSSGDMLGRATTLAVADDATFSQGAEMLLEIKRIGKTVESRFEEPVSMAHKAHRSLTALRDNVLSPFKESERIIKKKLGDYQDAVERKRRQEAERLRKESEAKAEAERLAKAEAQMDKGDLEACKRTLETPATPAPIRVQTPEAPKVAGLSFRDEWKFEVTDPEAVPNEYKCVDESKLRKVVKALGKAAANIPGIRVWSEKVASAGSGKAA